MTNEHILVTGGARGIGKGIVDKLASKDYKVTFIYRGSKEAADNLVAHWKEQGKDVEAYCLILMDLLTIQVSPEIAHYS